MLLGDVDELEVDGEGPDHRRLPIEREQAHRIPQLVARPTLARLPREQPDPFLRGEQLLALLLDQYVTEHVTEKPNVTPEPRVRAHRPILNARRGRTPPGESGALPVRD